MYKIFKVVMILHYSSISLSPKRMNNFLAQIQCLFGCPHDDVYVRKSHVLQRLCIRRRNLGTRYPFRWCVEIIESILIRQRHNLRPKPLRNRISHRTKYREERSRYEGGKTTVNTDDTVRLLDTIDDSINIKRFRTSNINNFRLNIMFLL